MTVKYLSVCSGIEAASVAFHPLGWKALAFSEIEAFPSAVLAHHYPTVPNLGDMTKWKSWDWDLLSEVDVLAGGPPCQGFSVAGLRAGLDDPRSQLTISYIHLLDHIDEIRSLYGKEPAICLYENVPGILSSKDNAFGAFLGGLAGEDCELIPSGGKWTNAGCVYGPKRSVAWRVLDAQYFGVAQRRKRVFVIASARDIDPSEILFEFDGVRRDTPPSRETGQGSTSAVGGSSTFKDTPILNDQGGSVMGVEDGLVGYAMQAIGEYSYMDSQGVEHVTTTIQSLVYPIHDKATRHGGERGVSNGLGIGQPTDPCPTLDTGGNHAIAIQGLMIGREDKNDPQGDGLNKEVSFTLNCVDRHAISYRTNAAGQVMDQGEIAATLNTFTDPTAQFLHTQMQVRRLTPIECERLQGFKDGWTRIPIGFYKNKKVTRLRPEDQWEKTEGGWYLMSADSLRYKSLGNSMAVPVMHWIGRRINDALIRLGR